jgi:ABC-type Fe3+-hydroxamate transport system substrate-binding protein
VTRVASLVPSVTETLLAWDVTPVACTRFCEQPTLRHVGGTKDPDVAAIIDLAPDLVVMCDEENRREDADALLAAGLAVHPCSPRSVSEVAPALADLADALGVAPSDTGPLAAVEPLGRRAFVPIWRRPWMTMNGETYGSSVLEWLGVVNVFGDAADRYPEVDLDAARAARPDVVLAPTEPYPFKERHLPELAAVAPPVLVDGQDLFWWGVRTPQAVGRLHEQLASLS